MRAVAIGATALGLAVASAPSAARAITLCDVNVSLRLAGNDMREGPYVGKWRDEKTGVNSCVALVIERVNTVNNTVAVVYVFGTEPVWSIAKPGFRRETYKLSDETMVLESLTNKYEFKLKGWDIEATYENANGLKTKGALKKQF